jgi:hypothetical protein
VIPHLIVLSLFAVLVGFLMFFAWVGIWINGRYPRRLWEVMPRTCATPFA